MNETEKEHILIQVRSRVDNQFCYNVDALRTLIEKEMEIAVNNMLLDRLAKHVSIVKLI